MPTPKREVRIPEDMWRGAMTKAQRQGTSAAGVIKILLAAWLGGSLDSLVAESLAQDGSESTVGGQQSVQADPPGSSTG